MSTTQTDAVYQLQMQLGRLIRQLGNAIENPYNTDKSLTDIEAALRKSADSVATLREIKDLS